MTLTFFEPQRILMLAAALGVSILTGFALAIAPVLVASVILGLLAMAMIVRRPELGALTILVLVAIVPRGVLFELGIPLGGGNLKVTDLLLAATIGCWLAARTLDPALHPMPSRPTTLLILGFLVLAIVAVLTANAMGTPQTLSLLELRPLLSYLLVFPLVSGARNWKQLHVGILLLLGAAVISAGISIVEYARGYGDVATFTGGALRVDPAILLFPLIGAVWAVTILAYAPSLRVRSATLGFAVVVIAGLFFTFQRGAWLGLLAGGALVLALLRPRRRGTTLVSLVVLVVVAAFAVATFNSMSSRQVVNPLSAGLERLTSISHYQDDISGRYRVAEWSSSINEIKRHPLTGIGLGTSITFTNPMFSPASNEYGFTFSTFYIHNSYLWFALKLGIVGAFVFFALIARVCWVALAGFWHTIDPREQVVLLACLGSLVAVLVLSAAGPHLNVDSATPAVAALIAGVEIARRLGARGAGGVPA